MAENGNSLCWRGWFAWESRNCCLHAQDLADQGKEMQPRSEQARTCWDVMWARLGPPDTPEKLFALSTSVVYVRVTAEAVGQGTLIKTPMGAAPQNCSVGEQLLCCPSCPEQGAPCVLCPSHCCWKRWDNKWAGINREIRENGNLPCRISLICVFISPSLSLWCHFINQLGHP